MTVPSTPSELPTEIRTTIDNLLHECIATIPRDLARAAHHAEEALRLSTESCYLFAAAEASRLLSIIHRRWSNFDDSLRLLELSLEFYTTLNDARGLGLVHSQLGATHLDRDDLPIAEHHTLQALPLLDASGHRQALATAHGNLGIVYMRSGRLQEAQQEHLKALAMHSELQFEEGIARQLGNLAALHAQLGELSIAIEYELRALPFFEQLGNFHDTALSRCNLATWYRASGRNDLAVAYAQSALSIARSHGLKRQEQEALRLIEE